jgi:OFA family oxalate/formate antiporter-like MFS transporter
MLSGMPTFFRGWHVVAATSAALLGAAAYSAPVLSVFLTPLGRELGWSRTEITLAMTLGGGAGALAAPFLGRALDRWGGRWVMSGSAAVMAACLALIPHARSIVDFWLLFGIGRMLQETAVRSGAFVAVSNWFLRRRSLAVGIVSSAERVGQGSLPVLVALLVAGEAGWRAGWTVLAGLLALCGLPSMIWVRRRPEDVGLVPDGDLERAGHRERKAPTAEPAFTLREAVSTRTYWLLGLASVVGAAAAVIVNFHLIPHLQHQGLGPAEAALAMTIISLLAIPGGLLAGGVALQLGPQRVLAVSLLLQACGVALLPGVHDTRSLLLAAVIYGLPFGAMVPLLNVVVADRFGRHSLGAIRGSLQPAQLAAMALAPLAVSYWVDLTGSYREALYGTAALFVVAAGALAVTPRTTAGDHGRPGGA